ncbi:MAG: hypothetical protein KatS3mg121_0013 [Gammaproteobacteria bacterium]|nr:MAG: hypothetical protein KatS3mg121_0013 [Gammaproteobacteria bacterium]
MSAAARPAGGYGRALAEARAAAGWSVHDVAQRLRLAPALIEALEAEDEARLPAPAYVRGYLRACAKLLDVPADALVAEYDRAHPEEDEAEPGARPQRAPAPGGGRKPAAVALLVLLVGGGAAALWWFVEGARPRPPVTGRRTAGGRSGRRADCRPSMPSRRRSRSRCRPRRAGPPRARRRPRGPNPPPCPGRRRRPRPAPRPKRAGRGAHPALGGMPAGADPAAREVLEAAGVEDGPPLRLQLRGPSWIEIYDADGRRLVYGLFDADRGPIQVRGRPPLQVLLGDGTRVELEYAGRRIDLGPHLRANRTARLNLRPDSP